MSWRPANIEPENNRAWAGVHWLNQEIRAESILRPTAARADSTALSRRSELSLITLSLIMHEDHQGSPSKLRDRLKQIFRAG
jgi:hypothetical protein